MREKCTLQSLGVEAAQRSDDVVIARPGRLLLLDQKQLVPTRVSLAPTDPESDENVGRIGDVREVQSNGSRGVVGATGALPACAGEVGTS